jgi:hypothetical protein
MASAVVLLDVRRTPAASARARAEAEEALALALADADAQRVSEARERIAALAG